MQALIKSNKFGIKKYGESCILKIYTFDKSKKDIKILEKIINLMQVNGPIFYELGRSSQSQIWDLQFYYTFQSLL